MVATLCSITLHAQKFTDTIIIYNQCAYSEYAILSSHMHTDIDWLLRL